MVSEIKKNGYGTVYQAVTRNPDIPAAAKGLYAYLSAFCGASNECFPSVNTITSEMGMSKDAFYRHINALVAAGIVEKRQTAGSGGKFGHTVYRLTHKVDEADLPCTEKPCTDNPYAEKPCTDFTETKRNSIQKEQRVKINKDKNSVSYQQVVDLYNSICTSFPKLTRLSDRRKQTIRARLNQGYTLDDFKKLFELAEDSSFLKGGNNRNWRATFDWLIADANMAKVLDCNYTDKKGVDTVEPENKGRRPASDYFRRFIRDCDCNQG